MRTAFIDTLLDKAKVNARLFLVTADLGYSVLERFRDALPQQFLNVGVAEQNMTGIAAGLSHTGKIVFTYSIANFPTLRCFEQIRNDVCYHGLAVRIVAVGGGMTYSTQGYTHHGVEDLGVMRTLPGMIVLAPGDPVEAACATRALCDVSGPAYLRLGKAGEPRIHSESVEFEIGKAILLQDGGDVTLVSTGGMLPYTVQTAEKLRKSHGVKARVLSMHTIKPLDVEALRRAATETAGLVTVEEHNVGSGLGSVVGDALAQLGVVGVPFRKYGLPDEPYTRTGSYEYMRQLAGDLEHVVLNTIRRRPESA